MRTEGAGVQSVRSSAPNSQGCGSRRTTNREVAIITDRLRLPVRNHEVLPRRIRVLHARDAHIRASARSQRTIVGPHGPIVRDRVMDVATWIAGAEGVRVPGGLPAPSRVAAVAVVPPGGQGSSVSRSVPEPRRTEAQLPLRVPSSRRSAQPESLGEPRRSLVDASSSRGRASWGLSWASNSTTTGADGARDQSAAILHEASAVAPGSSTMSPASKSYFGAL